MKRLVMGILLAATSLSPVTAQAQQMQRQVDGERRERGDRPRLTPEQRQERRAERAERRAERADAGPVVDRRRDPAFRPDRSDRSDRPNRRFDGDGERTARPDRMFPRRDGQVFPPARDQRREVQEARRDVRQDRGDWRERRRDDWRDDRRDTRRDYRDDHRGYRADRRDDRDWAGWGRNAYGGGTVWNRGWRNDRRYDWNRYRDSNRGLYRLPRYYAPGGYGYQYRRFGLGATLSRSLFEPSYWIDDAWGYRLPPAYGPYRWVRYYDDALLVDLRTGRVIDVVNDIFY